MDFRCITSSSLVQPLRPSRAFSSMYHREAAGWPEMLEMWTKNRFSKHRKAFWLTALSWIVNTVRGEVSRSVLMKTAMMMMMIMGSPDTAAGNDKMRDACLSEGAAAATLYISSSTQPESKDNNFTDRRVNFFPINIFKLLIIAFHFQPRIVWRWLLGVDWRAEPELQSWHIPPHNQCDRSPCHAILERENTKGDGDWPQSICYSALHRRPSQSIPPPPIIWMAGRRL